MEAVGATASIVGIVSFGLGLAKSLQAFIDTIIEAEETITLIVADVNATASTLERLNDFIGKDKTSGQEQHRVTVFNDKGIKEIEACALQYQKVYVQIIILIEKAIKQAVEDGPAETTPQASVAGDMSAYTVRLAAFSNNVSKLSRRMKWPWLEPRIKRCQEHLGLLKLSLMLSLQVFLIAESRIRPEAAQIFATDDKSEMRSRAEILRRKMIDFASKKGPSMHAERQLPDPDAGSSSRTSIISMTVATRSKANDVSMSSSSRESYRDSWPKLAAALARALVVYARKKTAQNATFRFDSTSAIFEAFLVYPSNAGNISQPPIKLPFGHRRLTREVKLALRKHNPWEVLLTLSPQHRLLIDRTVQQVQVAAGGSMSVCLVAIDIKGHRDVEISKLEVDNLPWNRMILFHRHEPLPIPREKDSTRPDVIGGRPRFMAILRSMLLSSQRRGKERLDLQARLKREEEKNSREEAKAKEERENIERDKAENEEAKRTLQTERLRLAEEMEAVETKNQVILYAEEEILKGIAKGHSEQEMKKIFEEQRAKMEVEGARKAIGHDRLPIKFKDAVGRKFSFPFHLVQTWKLMENLIKEAFLYVHPLSRYVHAGNYDPMDPEGQVILPSTWEATIKPGTSVEMRMWPPQQIPNQTSGFEPGQPQSSYARTPGQPPGEGFSTTLRPAGTVLMPNGLPHSQHAARPPPPMMRMPPPPPAPFWDPARPSGTVAMEPVLAKTFYKKKESKKRAKKVLGFFSGAKPPNMRVRPVERSWAMSSLKYESDIDKDLDDIDKELGLGKVKALEQMAAKDVDELLKDWTNTASNEEHDDTSSSEVVID
ncbi:hypothetical protein Daus18300_012148 [Diaporthe australafricana]|uniref:Ubiquitin-like domain-containing protein n=1 Tax=Diaporthe australafricana TaxID=127596 RepID=A0ABR3W3Q7_9PEZI